MVNALKVLAHTVLADSNTPWLLDLSTSDLWELVAACILTRGSQLLYTVNR
jgi:hypothetical protein